MRNTSRKFPRKTARPYFERPDTPGIPVESNSRSSRHVPEGVPWCPSQWSLPAKSVVSTRARRVVVGPGHPLPEGAVFVGAPSRWANPFSVTVYGQELSLRMFRDTITGMWNPAIVAHLSDAQYREVTHIQQRWRERLGYGHALEAVRAELRGKDLGCRCPEGFSCHADVLLDLAAS